MASKIKVDQLETADGSGTIALQNQLSGMTGASMPTGSVLQVVQDTHGAEQNSTSTTFADTGLTATITPSSSSSKILVCVQHTGCAKYGTSNNNGLSVSLLRGSSVIAKVSERAGYDASTGYNWIGGLGTDYLDSPNTTNATTYKTQYKSRISGATVRLNDENTISSITLMEIAG
jgi:hypothetical protein